MSKNPRYCNLREQNGKRSMVVKDVTTVEEAVSVLQEIVAMQGGRMILLAYDFILNSGT